MIITSIFFSTLSFLASKVVYPNLKNGWYYFMLIIGITNLILGIVYYAIGKESNDYDELIGLSIPVMCFVAGHFFWKKRKIK